MHAYYTYIYVPFPTLEVMMETTLLGKAGNTESVELLIVNALTLKSYFVFRNNSLISILDSSTEPYI